MVGIGTTALVPLTLAYLPTTPVLCAAAFASGVALEQFTVAWETSLQQHISPSRPARVYSYDALGSCMAIPPTQIAVGTTPSGSAARRPWRRPEPSSRPRRSA